MLVENSGMLVSELAQMLGIEIAIDSSGCSDVLADGEMVTMKRRDSDWLFFAAVHTLEEGDDRLGILARAMECNLFGAGTSGMHLGLFADTVILSATAPADGLGAEGMALAVLAIAGGAKKARETILGGGSANAAAETPIPPSFMQV